METSKKILFIGGFFLDSNESRVRAYSKGAVQNAANKLQWNYIKGIEANLFTSLDLLNSVYVGTYPKYYSKLFVKGVGEYVDKYNRKIRDVGFVNLPVIAEKSKYYNLKWAIRKWVDENKGKHLYIIAYGFFEQNIRILAYAKKCTQATTCLIIPDLPQYMSLNRKVSGIRRAFLNHINNLFNKYKKDIDYFSVITEQMGDYLKIPHERYVVIDGMSGGDSETLNTTKELLSNVDAFSFLYTGGLSQSYGTDLLINSFMELENKNVELWICGDGPYTDEIKRISKDDCRVRYFGVLPQNECISLQLAASCLINPREDSDITKYSFPSKTMEYLNSGRPVIAKKLLGMGEEYSDIFFQFNNEETLKEVMDRVSMTDPQILEEVGNKGKQFVSNQKNNRYQTAKLIKLLALEEMEREE